MQRNNDAPFKRQSKYNSDRNNFLDSDFNYVYRYQTHKADGTYERKEIKIPYSEENHEVFIVLDRDDYEADLCDRYEEDNEDWNFRNLKDKYTTESNVDSDVDQFKDDPVDCIPSPSADVFELAFPEYKETTLKDPRLQELRDWIFTLPESQQNLIFTHLGEDKFLEDIRRQEEQETGKKITKQAMHNRWNKILIKACNHFGVEKPKQKHSID